MSKAITVETQVEEFMAGVECAKDPALSAQTFDTIRSALKHAFLSGVSSGAAIVTGAFERSQTPAELERHLDRIKLEIDSALESRLLLKAH